MIKLLDILLETLTEKKLCPKGRAYYNRRIAAGEKPSAYLSGRAVKVCKGLMEGGELNEEIDPSEAYSDIDAVNTIVQGKRKIAFIVEKANNPDNWKRVQKIIADNNLKTVYVKGNPNNAYIVYTSDNVKDAMELKALAEKYKGYLSANATKEDTRRIGELLGYTKDKIDAFIAKNYPNEPVDESLRDWFKKEDWVRIDTQGNITGPCGTMKKGNATTRCLPRAKANSLTKAERAATSRKKVAGSKKGKQFVANTDKAKVRLRKNNESVDEISMKKALGTAALAVGLAGSPNVAKAQSPTPVSQTQDSTTATATYKHPSESTARSQATTMARVALAKKLNKPEGEISASVVSSKLYQLADGRYEAVVTVKKD
jgi:hypothetical protein